MAKSSQKRGQNVSIKESDRLLPLNVVFRLMKEVLPDGCKISKETKENMNESVSEFIGFIVNQSSEEYMLKENRKTILPKDILNSLKDVDFDIFYDPVSLYYKELINQHDKPKKNNKSNKK